MAIDLTLAECISLNSKLESADGKDDELTLTEIMTSLKAADPRNKMQNISKSKLGKTVMRLSRRNEPAVKKLAEQLLEQWKAQIKKPGSTTPAKTPAPVAATKPAGGSGDAVKSEQQPAAVASPANAATAPAVEAAPAAEATCKSEGRGRLEVNEAVKIESLAPSGSSSMTSPRPPPGKLLPTGDAVRDSVCEKLKEVFVKGMEDNAKLLRELDADPVSMAQECEAAIFKEFKSRSARSRSDMFQKNEYKVLFTTSWCHLPSLSRAYTHTSLSVPCQKRFRSLIFNLKDPNNPDFILSVVTGRCHVTELATMEAMPTPRPLPHNPLRPPPTSVAHHAHHSHPRSAIAGGRNGK